MNLVEHLARGLAEVDATNPRHDASAAASAANLADAEKLKLAALAALGANSEDLEARLAKARQRAAVMSMVAGEVSRRLDDAAVAHVFFKGVVVDPLFYGGRGLRGTSDVDVLVADLARAEAALAPIATGAAAEKLRPRLSTQRTSRSIPARVLGADVLVDVQGAWLLSPPLVDDTRAVLERRVRDAGPAKLPRPSHEDYAAYVGANLVMDRFSGRLKLALDLARMFTLSARNDIVVDWRVVVDRARSWRASGALWALASFVERNLAVPAPPHFIDALAPARWRRPLLIASVEGAPIPGALTRALEVDNVVAGARHFARYVPGRILDYLLDAP